MFESLEPEPLPLSVKGPLLIWLVILPPWMLLALMGTGMAFEGGYTLDAYMTLVVVWVYPALVAAAWFFRRKRPQLVWLPLLTAIP